MSHRLSSGHYYSVDYESDGGDGEGCCRGHGGTNYSIS